MSSSLCCFILCYFNHFWLWFTLKRNFSSHVHKVSKVNLQLCFGLLIPHALWFHEHLLACFHPVWSITNTPWTPNDRLIFSIPDRGSDKVQLSDSMVHCVKSSGMKPSPKRKFSSDLNWQWLSVWWCLCVDTHSWGRGYMYSPVGFIRSHWRCMRNSTHSSETTGGQNGTITSEPTWIKTILCFERAEEEERPAAQSAVCQWKCK